MNLQEFKESLSEESPPEVGDILKAMWYDANGEWDRAHKIVQDIGSWEAAWVHAYLHRKEGDLSNASYWYNRANKSRSDQPLEREWDEISQALLKQSG